MLRVRVAKMKALLISVALIAAIVVGMQVERYMAADACLDRGGRIGEMSVCEGLE